MSVYLFDMKGEPIAFRRTWTDPNIFDLHGDWIGWFPWGDHDAVDRTGRYLGTVVDDRFVRRNDWCARPCRDSSTHPDSATPTGLPLAPHAFPNRFAYEDVHVRILT
ncbi:hypothetical protein [Aeromicrobium sp.]|uniref:hypothetical protein n=1 Tax=Aeromicrobium sp. TaxID=1871063 RepID=UPI003C4E55A7